MKKNRLIKYCPAVLVTSLLTVTFNVAAEEKENKDESPWKSSIELGFIRTTGNTETQTTALKANASYEVDKWRHTGYAEGYGQEAKNKTTGDTDVSAERYELRGKSDYKFKERDYAFGLVKLEKDRFTGFQYEHIVSLGYGRKAIKHDDMELDLELGPGVRFYKFDDDPLLTENKSQDEAVLRLSADYWWAITGTSKFTQELSSDIGEQFTTIRSITGIQANINSTLALKFTYTIRNKSVVPEGVEKTDTETAMTLVYTF